MVWRLDLTGDVIPLGTASPEQAWAHLSVDNDGMLTFNYETLEAIVGKVIRAVNVVTTHVKQLQSDVEESRTSLHHLDRQLGHEIAKVEDAQAAVRHVQAELQSVQSIAAVAAPASAQTSSIPTPQPVADVSDVSMRLAALGDKIENLSARLEKVKVAQEESATALADRIDNREKKFQAAQGAVMEDFKLRLAANESILPELRSGIEKLGQQLAECEKSKASAAAHEALAARLEATRSDSQRDRQKLEAASENFNKLGELYDTVTKNTQRLQELWRSFKSESQEFRGWTCRALDEMRAAIRSKLDEHQVNEMMGVVRRELRQSVPELSHAVALRLESELQGKAGQAELLRLQEFVETLASAPAHKGRLLMGTKCLTCDRPVSTWDTTDQGRVDLEVVKQQEGIMKDVHRALAKHQDEVGGRGEDVLRYVAVRVGSPDRTTVKDGTTYETRSRDAGGTAAEFSLMKLLKPSRRAPSPEAMSGSTQGGASTPRRAPREVPPIVRVGPRRVKKLTPPGQQHQQLQQHQYQQFQVSQPASADLTEPEQELDETEPPPPPPPEGAQQGE